MRLAAQPNQMRLQRRGLGLRQARSPAARAVRESKAPASVPDSKGSSHAADFCQGMRDMNPDGLLGGRSRFSPLSPSTAAASYFVQFSRVVPIQ